MAASGNDEGPSRDHGHGPLPTLLLVLTILTGVVDAVSYLSLGHVFVANMTGNVVFLGFALAGALDVAPIPSITAMLAFVIGAVAGGRLAYALAGHRARIFFAATSIKFCFMLAAAVLAATVAIAGPVQLCLIALLATSMGLQNAAVRKINVPDLTTTVLTMTLTGIGADSGFAGGNNPRLARRLASILAMALGAFAGGFVELRVSLWAALALAAALAGGAAAVSYRWSRERPAWAVPVA